MISGAEISGCSTEIGSGGGDLTSLGGVTVDVTGCCAGGGMITGAEGAVIDS